MKYPVLVLLVLAILVCVVPVSAEYVITGANFIDYSQALREQNVNSYVYQALPDESIASIEFIIPIGTVINFTLYYGTVSTVTGYCNYSAAGLIGLSNSKIKLGADENTYSENFIDAQALGYSVLEHIQFNSYAQNRTLSGASVTSGFALYAPGYGYFSDEIVYYEVPDLPSNLIYGITMVSNQPITIRVNTAKTEVLGELTSKTFVDRILDLSQTLQETVNLISKIFFSVTYWLNLLFVQNLILTMALYFGVTMAYSFGVRGGDIFSKIKYFFGLQKKMLEFIIGSFNTVVQMITATINAFKP